MELGDLIETKRSFINLGFVLLLAVDQKEKRRNNPGTQLRKQISSIKM